MDLAWPGGLRAALVGRTILCWWPVDGWQRGTVARLCPRGAFSHVVAYTRQTSALRGTADTLLDAASYGIRWVLLGVSSQPLRPPDLQLPSGRLSYIERLFRHTHSHTEKIDTCLFTERNRYMSDLQSPTSDRAPIADS